MYNSLLFYIDFGPFEEINAHLEQQGSQDQVIIPEEPILVCRYSFSRVTNLHQGLCKRIVKYIA